MKSIQHYINHITNKTNTLLSLDTYIQLYYIEPNTMLHPSNTSCIEDEHDHEHVHFKSDTLSSSSSSPPLSSSYYLTDDLVFLCCDVDSLTSYKSIRTQWYQRDSFQSERYYTLISILFYELMLISLFVVFVLTLNLIPFSFCVLLFYIHIIYVHYLCYCIGRRREKKDRDD